MGSETRKTVLLLRQNKLLIKRVCLTGAFCSFRVWVKCHLSREFSLTAALTFDHHSYHLEHLVLLTGLTIINKLFWSLLASYSMGRRITLSLLYLQCLEKHLAHSRCSINT